MKAAKRVHAEAFCLITYRSADGQLEEQIWNRRAGTAPLVVYARDAETPLAHVKSGMAQYSASYQPKIGDRIFIDMPFSSIIAYKRPNG